jgi:hypothetical protein
MTKAARLVLIDREMLVKEQQLAESADLALAIERGLIDLAESVVFYPIKVGNDAGDLPIEIRRHLPCKVSR